MRGIRSCANTQLYFEESPRPSLLGRKRGREKKGEEIYIPSHIFDSFGVTYNERRGT